MNPVGQRIARRGHNKAKVKRPRIVNDAIWQGTPLRHRHCVCAHSACGYLSLFVILDKTRKFIDDLSSFPLYIKQTRI